MAQLVLTSNTLAGTPATGTLEYNGQFFGTDSAAARAQMQRITQGTAVASTSGTSIDFTSIPAWVKRITVMFNAVSTNGTSGFAVQLGTSGGLETTGYLSGCSYAQTGNQAQATNSTTSLLCAFLTGAALTNAGSVAISSVGSNAWVSSGTICTSSTYNYFSGGAKTLTGTLDRIRITTVNGTDTFDAGSINILYEG